MDQNIRKSIAAVLVRTGGAVAASAMLLTATSSAHAADNPPMGAVVLDCGWTAILGVNDCKLVSEAPAGLGLGAAAMSAAEGFNLVSGYQPPLENGRFRIRIGVKIPDPGNASAAGVHTPAG